MSWIRKLSQPLTMMQVGVNNLRDVPSPLDIPCQYTTKFDHPRPNKNDTDKHIELALISDLDKKGYSDLIMIRNTVFPGVLIHQV